MQKRMTPPANRPASLPSAVFVAFMLFGMGSTQAQEASSATEAVPASQAGRSAQGMERSDTGRTPKGDSDADGDGLGDATAAARQADLKKLADELVNTHQPAAAEDDDADGVGGPDHARVAPSEAEGDDEGSASQKREKMKRLESTKAEPLELMDETDTCPTLPCP